MTGAGMILYSTVHGPGISPDSATYLGVAESIRNGHGFYIPFYTEKYEHPMSYYPPLYPLLLAAGGIIPGSAESSVRYGNALCFGALICLVGWLAYRLTRSYILSIFAAFLLSCAETIVGIYSWAWSEPPFLLVAFTGIAFLSVYLETRRTAHLVAAGAMISAATLIRYAGLGFVITLWLALVVFRPGGLGRRLVHATVAAGATALPVLIWIFRNRQNTGRATGFIAFHPPALHVMSAGIQSTIRLWLATLYYPQRASQLLTFVGILIVAALIGRVWRAMSTRDADVSRGSRSLGGLLALSVFIYVAFIIGVICFLNAITLLDERILAPALIMLVLLIIRVVGAGLLWVRRPIALYIGIRVVVVALLVYIGSGWVTATRKDVAAAHAYGLGLNSASWKSSKIIQAIAALPPNTVIYTNAPDIVYPMARRLSEELPFPADPVTAVTNTGFATEIGRIREQLWERGGFVVYFYQLSRPWCADDKEVARLLRVKSVYSAQDGSIYAARL
jgi:4-amino-4-deoxy-L-arabinose transferase-like glycosyltransferase